MLRRAGEDGPWLRLAGDERRHGPQRLLLGGIGGEPRLVAAGTGDVPRDADVAADLPGPVADRADAQRHRNPTPVLVDVVQLERLDAVRPRGEQDAADPRRPAALGRDGVDLRHVVKHRRAVDPDHLGGRVADHPLGAAIEHRDQSVRVGAAIA